MTSPSDPEVIIVGAGMAGATLALALTDAGLPCVMIDPQTFAVQTEPRFDGRATAIAFAAFRQWRALGVSDALEPLAERINQILVTDGEAPGAAMGSVGTSFLRFDAEEIADRCDGEPLGYMLENRHIRAGLAQAVVRRNIDVLSPAEVSGLEVTAPSAIVSLTDGRQLQAPLVIGADGRRSTLRRLANLGEIGWTYNQVGIVATVSLERPHLGIAHEHFLPAGPFAVLPLTGQRASLVWTEAVETGAALMAASPEAFQAHLQRRFGDYAGRVQLDGPRFSYPLALSLAEKTVSPRVALLGDAAHSIHPIAGQGLNMGLKDAAALAEVLVEARRLGEDIGSAAVLERYARWRQFDNVMLALATDGFNRLFSNAHPLLRRVRGAGLALVNRVAPARSFFMREAGGATGDLPRLLRGQALS